MDPTTGSAYIVVNMDQGELGTPLPLVYPHKEEVLTAIMEDCAKLLDGNKQALDLLGALYHYIALVLDGRDYPILINLEVARYMVHQVERPY